MKWPELVPPAVCRVPIAVTLTNGNDEDAAPRVAAVVETMCSYNGKGGWSVDERRQAVRYTASALFPGDIAPELVHLTGWADVLGARLTIHAADRARNPDGTVNYIQLGGIDGNTEKYIGVYPGKPPAAQRVCLGGAEQTRAGEFYAAVLVHWGRNMRSAQAKADAVYALFYARGAFDMDGCTVCAVEPGGGPVPVGKDDRGVCEFVINLKMTYMKE